MIEAVKEKVIPVNSVVAVVDMDNVFSGELTSKNRSVLISILNDILSIILENSNEVDNIVIRLYGGWYSDSGLTQRASFISQIINSERFFPLKTKENKIIHGEIELTTSLSQVDNFIWSNTHVRRNGLPNLRIDKGNLLNRCGTDNRGCPAHQIKRFTKRKDKICYVEDCNVKNEDAFIVVEQKMIDTLMSIDIYDFSHKDEVKKIFVFSDDIDLMPAVLRSHISKKNTVVVVLGKLNVYEKYNELVSKFQLRIIDNSE